MGDREEFVEFIDSKWRP